MTALLLHEHIAVARSARLSGTGGPGPATTQEAAVNAHAEKKEEEVVVKITALTDGPLLVEGLTELVDQNGKQYAHPNAAKFALCRCGGSSKRPFCDGTHAKNGFRCPPQ